MIVRSKSVQTTRGIRRQESSRTCAGRSRKRTRGEPRCSSRPLRSRTSSQSRRRVRGNTSAPPTNAPKPRRPEIPPRGFSPTLTVCAKREVPVAGDVAREQPADERERIANEREWLADERERLADERERLADERDSRLDERERRPDGRESKLQ